MMCPSSTGNDCAKRLVISFKSAKKRSEDVKRTDVYAGIERDARKRALCEGDDLRVRFRECAPYELDSELPELTISSGLRPLIPEAIAKIIELEWLGGRLEFGLQRERPSAFVCKTIQLIDNRLARFDGKKLQRFESRGGDLTIAPPFSHVSKARFDEASPSHFRW